MTIVKRKGRNTKQKRWLKRKDRKIKEKLKKYIYVLSKTRGE